MFGCNRRHRNGCNHVCVAVSHDPVESEWVPESIFVLVYVSDIKEEKVEVSFVLE